MWSFIERKGFHKKRKKEKKKKSFSEDALSRGAANSQMDNLGEKIDEWEYFELICDLQI